MFDCTLRVTQPYLWKNHAQQVQGAAYQLQKYLLINVEPFSSQKEDCPITKFNITGLEPGVEFDGKGLVTVDKDIVTGKLRFDMRIWVGSQVFDLPYVTVMPRKDPFAVSVFVIFSIILLVLVLLLCCILCYMCAKVKKMSADAEIQMTSGPNADVLSDGRSNSTAYLHRQP